MAKQQGWIKLDRAFMEHAFWTEERVFSKAEAWIDLLLSANYGDGSFMINGQMVRVEPGQYCTTMAYLAKRWGWSRGKVDRFIDMLENEQIVNAKRTSKYTLVTILNWAKYQDRKYANGHQMDIKQTSDGHQTDIKRALQKNNKKNKNNKNNIYTYPRPAYKPYETDDRDLSEFEE